MLEMPSILMLCLQVTAPKEEVLHDSVLSPNFDLETSLHLQVQPAASRPHLPAWHDTGV